MLFRSKDKNSHRRDRHIKFFEVGHKYTITTDPNSKYTSVTTWIHNMFPKFDADEIINKIMSGSKWNETHKYWGMTPDEIKNSWKQNGEKVSGDGTEMHYNIECFMNNCRLCEQPYTHKDLFDDYVSNMSEDEREKLEEKDEWQHFLTFLTEHPHLRPYRTEWTVYNEDAKLAGSIDMIYENDDGSLSIYDWKRSKEISKHGWGKFATCEEISHIPNANYWHYSLQLNTYRRILQDKYGKTVKELFLVRLHQIGRAHV